MGGEDPGEQYGQWLLHGRDVSGRGTVGHGDDEPDEAPDDARRQDGFDDGPRLLTPPIGEGVPDDGGGNGEEGQGSAQFALAPTGADGDHHHQRRGEPKAKGGLRRPRTVGLDDSSPQGHGSEMARASRRPSSILSGTSRKVRPPRSQLDIIPPCPAPARRRPSSILSGTSRKVRPPGSKLDIITGTPRVRYPATIDITRSASRSAASGPGGRVTSTTTGLSVGISVSLTIRVPVWEVAGQWTERFKSPGWYWRIPRASPVSDRTRRSASPALSSVTTSASPGAPSRGAT